MKPLSPVDRWMVKQNLGYVLTEGLQTVVDRLRQQGYDRVANAVEQEAKEFPGRWKTRASRVSR